MSAQPVDVLAVLDPVIYDPHSGAPVGVDEDRQAARAAVVELIEAAGNYFTRYAQDEASDDGQEWTGCTPEQHEDAKRLRAALARVGGAA